jgi:hypothetical protein
MVIPHLRKSQHAVIALTTGLMVLGLLVAVTCVIETIRRYGCRSLWASCVREQRVLVVGAVRLPKRTTPTELELGELATVDVAR